MQRSKYICRLSFNFYVQKLVVYNRRIYTGSFNFGKVSNTRSYVLINYFTEYFLICFPDSCTSENSNITAVLHPTFYGNVASIVD